MRSGQARIVHSLALLAAVVALAGCGTSGSGSETPATTAENEDRPGSAAVYQRIESMTDCDALQRQFDIAGDNADRMHDAGQTADIPMSYMDAADARMKEVGCYG